MVLTGLGIGLCGEGGDTDGLARPVRQRNRASDILLVNVAWSEKDRTHAQYSKKTGTANQEIQRLG